MDRIVPAESWLRVTGPRLWATLVATTRVFHRARPPTTTDRYWMTFTYSSATPYEVLPQYMLSRPTQRRLRINSLPGSGERRCSIDRVPAAGQLSNSTSKSRGVAVPPALRPVGASCAAAGAIPARSPSAPIGSAQDASSNTVWQRL